MNYPDNDLQVKEQPKHYDFINSCFNELKKFNIEEQVDILHTLYRRLEDVYQSEIEVNLKTADDFKCKLLILKKLEPKRQEEYPCESR